ncbi:MAG: formate dehydrogenase subunit gamma [Planctomycetota bacterium]
MPSSDPNRAAPDAATQAQFAVIDAAITRLKDLPGALLPILHAIQDQLGYVPPAATERLAKSLNISLADVHGVITFYHDFRSKPPGRHVLKLCRAEACQSMGCERLEHRLREHHGVGMKETSADGNLTVEPVYCLGNCALSPALLLDGNLQGRVTEARLDELLASTKTAGGRA